MPHDPDGEGLDVTLRWPQGDWVVGERTDGDDASVPQPAAARASPRATAEQLPARSANVDVARIRLRSPSEGSGAEMAELREQLSHLRSRVGDLTEQVQELQSVIERGANQFTPPAFRLRRGR